MQQKKELNWVNAAKALCMIAVLFVHSENYYGMRLGEVNTFICGFYVNAFFMIMFVFALTLFISYIVSMVIVRYLPWLLDIRKIKKQ